MLGLRGHGKALLLGAGERPPRPRPRHSWVSPGRHTLVAVRAPPPPRDGRLVWPAVRPALLTTQVCSLLLISLEPTTTRLSWLRVAFAVLVAVLVMAMGCAVEVRAGTSNKRSTPFGHYAALFNYAMCLALVLLWARAANRCSALWERVDELEARLWARGVHRLPRLRRHALAVTGVVFLVLIPQQAFVVWRRLPLRGLFHLGQLVSGVCIAGVFNFSALLLMVLSEVLAECFRALASLIRRTAAQSGNRIPPEVVEGVRVLYNEVCGLARTLDHSVGAIFMSTLVADGLYICQFLLSILTRAAGRSLYSAATLAVVAARFFLTIFAASSVHGEWRSARSCLLRTSPYRSGKEVLRFFMQVATDRVSLTALGVVPITRPLMLALLGSILSYEIVLVQFNNNNS
ncbi:Gustatory receptor 48 [Frankliniella occidentalis]|uniref:Uncharacterized protein LOC113211674 isoform X2 n=1 Tax=Frankliniella occidentalis TaxID=133901 RepID=A0A9C6XV83_FRAOC|nr:uncharacterized protein LOC113211674 isoform X2 [Frankliniella occidentalis]KAE8737408.1 Gustatory receptor 48 [Frankliniella occidentalis]